MDRTCPGGLATEYSQTKHCPRRAGTCWELLVEWGIVGPDRRQWPRLVEFRFDVGLKYPAHMAKRQWWHARDEIDPVNGMPNV